MKIFGRTKAIEADIDAMLDAISEQGMLLEQTLLERIEAGVPAEPEARAQFVQRMVGYKRRVSELRRSIETTLVREMLIPDQRGEVMAITERLHDFAESVSHLVRNAALIHPEVPPFVVPEFEGITRAMARCVEHMVSAARAYFRDVYAVRDHVHKVGFYEGESDDLADKAIQKIFESDLELAQKMLVHQFVLALDGLSDAAESIADSLNISALKRQE